ncbi:MAG TPA: ferritin family protein [Candidatus Cloacimonetes bacterium]|nr:ferritin family protein [Candidatus Cloacimonadota bacterium]
MNNKEELLRLLKIAMQGEMDSITLYQNASDHSTDEEVKAFFNERRDEEKQHYSYLLKYYQQLSEGEELVDFKADFDALGERHPIISKEFVKRVGEDQYLFSAISTALLLEKNAIDHYRESAKQTKSDTLGEFFAFMEEWEKRHYDDLVDVQKEAERYYWDVNKFEPF